MHEPAAAPRWIPILSVPALAIALKFAAERAGLVDSLSAPLREKLSSFDYSYPDHWVVTATTREGRRFSRLVINKRFQLESQASPLLKLGDLEDLAWEGPVAVPVGPVVPLSGSRSRTV